MVAERVSIQPSLWSVGEYERLCRSSEEMARSTELLNGVILKKMGQNPPHIYSQSILLQALASIAGADGLSIVANGPLTLNDASRPEPDLMVIQGPFRGVATPENVRIVIEVSDTSYRLDATDKYLAYAEAGIPEYWVVDVNRRLVEVHRDPSPDGYGFKQTFSADAELLGGATDRFFLPLETKE